MLQKFKDLTKGQKIIVSIIGLLFFPITLIALSIDLIVNGVKNKKTLKIVTGIICTLFTFVFAIGFYSSFNSTSNSSNKQETENMTVKEDNKENSKDISAKVKTQEEIFAEEEEKYGMLLTSGKTYEEMSNQERSDFIQITQTINNFTTQFQEKYKDTISNIEVSKEEAEAKWAAQREAEEQARKAQKEAEEKAKKEAEARKYDTGLTYEDLARNPEQHALKYCKFSGKIIQVMKGDDAVQYRMAINNNYDKVVLIEIPKSLLTEGNILEGDLITIKGQFVTEMEYTTVMGAVRTIPAILVEEFTFN